MKNLIRFTTSLVTILLIVTTFLFSYSFVQAGLLCGPGETDICVDSDWIDSPSGCQEDCNPLDETCTECHPQLICTDWACGTPDNTQTCPSGQVFCGGCIGACRPNTQTCTAWIDVECSGDTGGDSGSGSWGSCGSCSTCGQSTNLCVTTPDGGCVPDYDKCHYDGPACNTGSFSFTGANDDFSNPCTPQGNDANCCDSCYATWSQNCGFNAQGQWECSWQGWTGQCYCAPQCNLQCGQADGCGGGCGTVDAAVPAINTNLITPAEYTNIVISQPLTINWAGAASSTTNVYQVILVASGINSQQTLFNQTTSQTSITINPTQHSTYSLSIRPINTTCSSYNNIQYGGWINKTFRLLVPDPWWQIRGGNMYSGQTSSTAVYSQVPLSCVGPLCVPALAGPNLNQDSNTDGIIITAGGTVDANSNISLRNPDPVVTGSTDNKYDENYSYFSRLLGVQTTSNDFSGREQDILKPEFNPDKDYYYQSGDVTLQTPWNVAANESYIVFIDGNLTLRDGDGSSDQLTTVEPGGFLMFVVSGDINIDPYLGNDDPASETPNLEGIYVANGFIRSQSKGSGGGGDARFIGAGTFVGWSGVILDRDFGDGDGSASDVENVNKPVEMFVYRPDLVINTPDSLLDSQQIWQETN